MKITLEKKKEICKLYAEGVNVKDLASRYDVCTSTIRNVINEGKEHSMNDNPFLGKGNSIGYRPKTEDVATEVESDKQEVASEVASPELKPVPKTRREWFELDTLESVIKALVYDDEVKVVVLDNCDSVLAIGVTNIEKLTVGTLIRITKEQKTGIKFFSRVREADDETQAAKQ